MDQGIKRDLEKLPRDVKTSPLYKRLADDAQRHYCFIHLAKMSPIEESNVVNYEDIPGLSDLFERPWAKWLCLEAPYSEELVKEFVTTMECVFEENEDGENVEVGVEAMVKGTWVKITVDGFNEYFGCEESRPEEISEVDKVE